MIWLKRILLPMLIDSLYRYPVKGLTPERLSGVALTPGRAMPWDRAFALAQGDAKLDEQNPAWISKVNFLTLARNPAAARLRLRFDEAARLLTIEDRVTAEKISASPFCSEGAEKISAFLTAFLGPDARYGAGGKPPRFCTFPAHSFCDHKTQVVSLIGLGSLRALEEAVGAPRDKLRFRANIFVHGLAPWEEFSWLGKTLAIGGAKMVVQDRIDRCPATWVNPETAEVDANPVKELRQHFGHIDMGVFAEVVEYGTVMEGDEIRVCNE